MGWIFVQLVGFWIRIQFNGFWDGFVQWDEFWDGFLSSLLGFGVSLFVLGVGLSIFLCFGMNFCPVCWIFGGFAQKSSVLG